ncbi:MAG: toxin Bro, partial [Ruminococcus sp.]|nr:toxin Bro [Ruminococcus sp.]
MTDNEIILFKHEEFGEIRTLNIDGEPWFVGKDVCIAFGDKNHIRSLGRVDEVDKQKIELTDSMNRKQSATVINESGLYTLLFAMQPQKANNDGVSDAYPIEVRQRISKLRKFKHWVTAEVLPSLRKHGAYITAETLHKTMSDPRELAKLLTTLADEQDKRR